ncbi:MAG: anthranilate synthase component I family protein [Clostridiales Family XIII bacterium]|jgi:anthranilate synthase component 1|nr:anthranilate synthase component I family protein [Clostridiales Family XIII bacterium]
MIKPDLETARELARGHSLLPISLELYADLKTPVEALRVIAAEGHEAYILESAPGGESWSRYTFLGYKPLMEVSGRGDRVLIREGGRTSVREGDPHALLKELAAARTSPKIPGAPPFTGGFVGYFAYEYFANIERTLRLTDNDETGMDDFRLLLFDKVIVFDHFKQTVSLIANIPTADLERSYINGVTELKDMERLLLSRADGPSAPSASAAEFSPSFSKEAFGAAVEKIKWHIREGDVFQCVPSVRFTAPHKGGLLEVYRKLRTTNPSAYMFYIRFDGLELAGASPETLVSLRNGLVSTYPLAGTCPRFEDDAKTAEHVARMLADEKELAEHDMLVDLGRNDLGKVCKFGTVKVEEYRGVKKLSQVCHIASKVTGELAEGFDPLDVMAAVLPAGTLSGAPKKRACEIIDEVEGTRRGVYGGAVGYMDFSGNMDLCIGIRMAALKDGLAYVQAGAGIVADSVPEKEYEECLRKAAAVLQAFGA